MIKNIIIFVTLLLWSNAILRAQGTTPNCTPLAPYVQQHDGTGKNPLDPTQLNAAAKELAQAFPEPYCSAFKVYDYGFTPISQYTKGGYAEDFELMKLQCSGVDREQPYLLFAREVNEVGIVTKIWVDVKLPKEGKFACLNATQRSLVKIRVEKAVEEAMGADKNNPLVISAEIMGMVKLKEEVVDIVNCCDKGRVVCTSCLKKDAVVSFFDNIGMYTQDATIATATIKNAINNEFAEYAEVKVTENGQEKSLNQMLSQVVANIKSANKTVKIFLTADVNFCFKTSSTSAKGMNPLEDLTIIDKVKLDFEAATEDYVLWVNASLENKVLFKKISRKIEIINNTPDCSCNRAYSGTATAQDRIYALQEIKGFANNLERKGVWSKIDKNTFCDELYDTVENFKAAPYLDQSNTYLCGPAGTLRIFCEFAPIEFVKFAINLYEKGEDKAHNITCNGKIIKANPITKIKDPSNGLSSVAYVLMTSIRSSYNSVLSYDPENETVLSGFGVPGESTKLLSNFGCIKNNTLKHIPSPHEGQAKELDPNEIRKINKERFMDNYLQMTNELDKGYIWFALINACYFGKLSNCNLIEEFGGDLTNGNHYIVITKMNLITPDILSLDLWTWGTEKKDFRISTENFMRATNWIWSYK
jgi:hypothetical protein